MLKLYVSVVILLFKLNFGRAMAATKPRQQ
jgi:hypothetical protein